MDLDWPYRLGEGHVELINYSSTVRFLRCFPSWISTIKSCGEELIIIIIIIIPLFTLGSIYSTNASGAEQIAETNNSN